MSLSSAMIEGLRRPSWKQKAVEAAKDLPPIVINGRFLTQRITGLQRYAREIVSRLDLLLGSEAHRTRLVAPGGVLDPIDLEHIQLRRDRVGGGLFCFPSKAEGFGLPVVEAMTRGCPVIASDCSSLPEIWGGAALLADPDSGPAWLRHIKSLFGSRLLREELAEKGRTRSRYHSWENSAQGYIELARRCDG